MKYGIIAILLMLAVFIGAAEGQTATFAEFFYKMDQKVAGEGFFSSSHNIVTAPSATTSGNLGLSKYTYGSGSYNDESTTTAQNGVNNQSGEYVEISEKNISLKETVDLAYAEKAFNLGNSFRSSPIKALGKEETCIENDGSGVSMDARFDSISTLSKDLSANLNWRSIESGTKDDPNDEYSLETRGITKLNVDATFTGEAHFGALAVNDTGLEGKGLNHNANIATLIDEDYMGTYTLSKKMFHEFNYKKTTGIGEWLDCCFGGWDTMNYYDTKGFGKSTKGVFDCTCYKFQKSAQFLEPNGIKAW